MSKYKKILELLNPKKNADILVKPQTMKEISNIYEDNMVDKLSDLTKTLNPKNKSLVHRELIHQNPFLLKRFNDEITPELDRLNALYDNETYKRSTLNHGVMDDSYRFNEIPTDEDLKYHRAKDLQYNEAGDDFIDLGKITDKDLVNVSTLTDQPVKKKFDMSKEEVLSWFPEIPPKKIHSKESLREYIKNSFHNIYDEPLGDRGFYYDVVNKKFDYDLDKRREQIKELKKKNFKILDDE